MVLTTVCWSGHGLLIILLWHSKYVLIVFHDLGGIELAQWRWVVHKEAVLLQLLYFWIKYFEGGLSCNSRCCRLSNIDVRCLRLIASHLLTCTFGVVCVTAFHVYVSLTHQGRLVWLGVVSSCLGDPVDVFFGIRTLLRHLCWHLELLCVLLLVTTIFFTL